MKKENWLFALIAVLLLITLMHGASAQRVFKSNYRVKVHLANKWQLKGTMVDASPDSLFIVESKKVVVGCRITIVLINEISFPGEVIALTDSLIEIKPKYGLNQVIVFQKIKSIKVRSYPPGYDKRIQRNTAIPVSEIQRLDVAREESGLNGALMGAVVAGGIGYAVGYETHSGGMFGPSFSGAGMAIIFVPIGALAGAAIAKSGRTYTIDGDRMLFDELIRKLSKPVKKPKVDGQEITPVVQGDKEELTAEQY